MQAGEVTIIDAGVSGFYKDITRELAAMGRRPADVRALILTHGHTDHIGFAERLRREAPAPVPTVVGVGRTGQHPPSGHAVIVRHGNRQNHAKQA
jgi:glyoxylase-like metal-dependent hydrolase (beta-lactamase superfamily II)